MNIDAIEIGKDAPEAVNVIIEVPMGGHPVKYEMDKDSGALFVDRMLHTPMRYPANYGFVPHTLSDDGDPADVLVIAQCPLMAGSVITARPIGVLKMEDDGGVDEKVLAVPISKLDPFYADVNEYTDLPKNLIDQIEHFFTHYKDLEKGKWVKIQGWAGAAEAKAVIQAAIEGGKNASV